MRVAVQTGLRLCDVLIAATFHREALMPLIRWLYVRMLLSFLFSVYCFLYFDFNVIPFFSFINAHIHTYLCIVCFIVPSFDCLMFLSLLLTKLKLTFAYHCREFVYLIYIYVNIFVYAKNIVYVCVSYFFVRTEVLFPSIFPTSFRMIMLVQQTNV